MVKPLLLCVVNFRSLVSFQVQALVGFEKRLKHLDDHLMEIGSKVCMKTYLSLKVVNY